MKNSGNTNKYFYNIKIGLLSHTVNKKTTFKNSFSNGVHCLQSIYNHMVGWAGSIPSPFYSVIWVTSCGKKFGKIMSQCAPMYGKSLLQSNCQLKSVNNN